MRRFTLYHHLRGRFGIFFLPWLIFIFPGGCGGETQSVETCPLLTPEGEAAITRPTRVPGQPVVVPVGPPPAVDGNLIPEEWDCAELEFFTDGSLLLLVQNDGYLYLAIQAKGSDMIVTNVHVEQADQIAVLHASAALGTARYELGEDGWEQTQAYDWCCRESNDDDEQARQDLLAAEGWLSANFRQGQTSEMEYQIKIPDGATRLAVVFMRVPEPAVRVAWPPNLADDCLDPQASGFSDHAHFAPETWVPLELEAAE